MFRKSHVLGLRIWHWLNALVILGLLSTVFLRDTFLNARNNASLMVDSLGKAGLTVTSEQAREVTKAIRNTMWDWHYYLGFTLTALFLIRLLVRKAPIIPQFSENAKKGRYFFAVKLSYWFFYLVITYMITSGLTMYFSEELHVSKSIFETIQEVHEWAKWFFIAFISAHVIGVIKAELTTDPGLVSDMINGGPINANDAPKSSTPEAP